MVLILNSVELLQDDKDLNSETYHFSSFVNYGFLTSVWIILTSTQVRLRWTSVMNYSDLHASEISNEIFNTQDREFLSVLENLMEIDDPLHSQNKNANVKVTSEGRISDYCC